MTKKLELFFYGNTFIPLADACYGCHHFNFVCGGSVTTDVCPTGEVENMEHSTIAFHFLLDERVNHNNFLLARANGENLEDAEHLEHIRDLENKIAANGWIAEKKDYVEALQKAVANYHLAVAMDETTISELQETYFEGLPLLEQTADDQQWEDETDSPFSYRNPNEVDDDDLPF